MASGGHVDRIAGEFGVHFISFERRISGAHQSKARRTCHTLLKKNGEDHLRLVFGLINAGRNRGNWSARCFTAVSWLVLNRPDLVDRADFVGLFDRIDLDALQLSARKTDPKAPTRAMTVLLSYEMDRLAAGGEMAA